MTTNYGMYNNDLANASSSGLYNTNTSHPLISNSQQYMFYTKFVSIHSEDRDLIKYPNSSEFEFELPEDMCNIASIKLTQWSFPANYNVFSITQGNIYFEFNITNPYPYNNTDIFGSLNEYEQRISLALVDHQNTSYSFYIEDGFYNPYQMATELTNKFNYTVSKSILVYFASQGWTDTISQFNANGGYSRFVIVYNSVNLKLWFGNVSDQFQLLSSPSIINNGSNVFCELNNGAVILPDSSNWGLSGFLGLPKQNVSAVNQSNSASVAILSSGETVPRFYYGDVNTGDNGFWLLPSTDLSGSIVYWVEPPYKINLMGNAYLYMELAGQNCIDEMAPFNISTFTKTTNSTNGTVNSSFAKLPIPSTPISQWFDKDSIPYKYYYPPAERIRRMKVKLRYHNGQLADFGLFNYSFMLEFTLQQPQLLRKSNSIQYPPSNR